MLRLYDDILLVMKNILRSKYFHTAILLIFTIGVYLSSLNGDFLYDDKPMIVGYDFIKDINNLPKAFISPTSLYGNTNYYRPLQTISNMTDYFLWGRYAAGFHITNILFHVLAVLLLYWLLQMLFKNRMLSFYTAMIFAVHPVNTSVVSYISGRADAMLLSFLLLSFGFYIKAVYVSPRPVYSVFSSIFFIFGLLSKEFAIMIPILFFFFDRYLVEYSDLTDKKKAKIEISRYVPYLAILAVYFLFRISRMSFFAEGAIKPFPFVNRIITVPYSLVQYLRLVILPNDLHMGRLPWVSNAIFDPRILISIAILCAVTAGVFVLRKENKAAWFGLLWFYLLIIPSLNVITPLFYTFAENWLYVPGIGLYVVLVSFMLFIKDRSSSIFRYVISLIFLAAIVFLGILTIKYNHVWKDEVSLGENTLKYNPREFKIWNNMGVVYLGRGDLTRAENAFKKCLEIKPDTGMAYFNLYRVYMAKNNRTQALEYLKKARKYDPKRIGILIEKMGIRE